MATALLATTRCLIECITATLNSILKLYNTLHIVIDEAELILSDLLSYLIISYRSSGIPGPVRVSSMVWHSRSCTDAELLFWLGCSSYLWILGSCFVTPEGCQSWWSRYAWCCIWPCRVENDVKLSFINQWRYGRRRHNLEIPAQMASNAELWFFTWARTSCLTKSRVACELRRLNTYL